MTSLTLEIVDFIEFKEGFLREHPIPTDEGGSPTMSELAWIHEWGRQQYQFAYGRGKTKLAQDAATINSEVITRNGRT